jgi:hypothetical protein
VGSALREISRDGHITRVMFEVLELQRLLESQARVTLLPAGATTSAAGAQMIANLVRDK